VERSLKKFIIYVLFVFTCGISIFFTYNYMQSSAYEATAIPYIETVLPQISTWDSVKVSDYMAPEVLERVTDAELAALMQSLSKIGTLTSIDKITFKNKASGENITREKQPLVTYLLEAEYSSGHVKVTLTLLDRGDSFDLYHFNFQSEALAQ
jgi:hypothetical protein